MVHVIVIAPKKICFESFQETFKSCFGYDLDYQVARYEIVHKLLKPC